MTNIYIQGQLLDQFKDENVEVVTRVNDIGDISKVRGDFSKTFTLPASKKNNQIFKHWYNASVDGGFDARTKVDGKIDIDGIPFKTGKFLLRSAQIDNGIITSYTVNFFGNLTSLKDTVGDDLLTSLNFDNQTHTYSRAEVLNRIEVNNTDLYPELIYTPVSKKRYYYDSSTPQNLGDWDSEKAKQIAANYHNIAYDAIDVDDTPVPSNKAIGMKWYDITPSLRCDVIIDAIEAKYPNLVFTRDFFDTTPFNRLYMFLSSSDSRPTLQSSTSRVDLTYTLDYYQDGGSIDTSNSTLFGGFTKFSTDGFTAQIPAGKYMQHQFNCLPSTEGTSEVRVRMYYNKNLGDGWELYSEQTGSCVRGAAGIPDQEFQADTNEIYGNFNNNDTIVVNSYFEVDVISGVEDIVTRIRTRGSWLTPTTYSTTYGSSNFTGTFLVEKNLPELKIIDFLKGIFQMFKLVVVPQEDGSLYVETLVNYYAQGSEYDISKYVDRNSLKVDRGDFISYIDFKNLESETILNYGFRKNNNRMYGSDSVEFKNAEDERLEGEELEIELPFEALLFEKLRDIGDNSSPTGIQTAHLIDDKFEPISIGPALHYAVASDVSDSPILVDLDVTGSGASGDPFVYSTTLLENEIYIPSQNIALTSPFASLLFRQEQNTWDGSIMTTSLYTDYYEDYVLGAYNIRSRKSYYRAKLPTIVSANLQMNDVLILDGIRYRINDFKYNLLTGLSDLTLLNTLNTEVTGSNGVPPRISSSSDGDSFSFSLSDSNLYTITLTDLGDGTSWISTSTSFEYSRDVQRHNTITITVDKYIGGDTGYRLAQVNLTRNGITNTSTVIQETTRI